MASPGRRDPSPILAALQQKPVTPALSAPGMPISSSSRRTSPVIFADTHDDRDVHGGAGSGSETVFKHVIAGAEAQHVERLAHRAGTGAAKADHFDRHARSGIWGWCMFTVVGPC